ncbi:hypothetical protein FNJ84_14330 [Paracoccus sp. M683]|uniref:hypothetical protein n=1 Tax=Paracoccus sp. M683 TaxID=2594268 RepID=UPI00117E66C3|nr:hypothetical protein [Paracoccus sp. M683]TRW96019.1 hypothetical protein FNJ84_14330 [Paracoccus sp. M683]
MFALTRIVLQADLRDYRFDTVRLIPGNDAFGLKIIRKPADDPMHDKITAILGAGGKMTQQLLSDPECISNLMATDDPSLTFRVMSQAVIAEDGKSELKAHKDAPDFYRFAKAIEACPRP